MEPTDDILPEHTYYIKNGDGTYSIYESGDMTKYILHKITDETDTFIQNLRYVNSSKVQENYSTPGSYTSDYKAYDHSVRYAINWIDDSYLMEFVILDTSSDTEKYKPLYPTKNYFSANKIDITESMRNNPESLNEVNYNNSYYLYLLVLIIH